jgi:hypothetical protein
MIAWDSNPKICGRSGSRFALSNSLSVSSISTPIVHFLFGLASSEFELDHTVLKQGWRLTTRRRLTASQGLSVM